MDGIILINKEKGYTSNDVVQIAKKIYNEKVGHTGTLDPMATGVLPLLIGKGTLISKYLINHDKTYIASLKLGESRNTGDIEGEIIEKKEVLPEMLEEKNIVTILNEFCGVQNQTPPIYSAIKIKGKKLYEYAREGKKVNIPSRQIIIYNIRLLQIDKQKKEIKFEVCCSKGTYIRTLCENIAERIGTVGYMSNLQRTKVGEFELKNAITINELKENSNKNFISIEQFFIKCDKIILNDKELKSFFNGVKLSLDKDDGIYRIYNKGFFIGIGKVENCILKRNIITFNISKN